jgi:hypothetical protein
VGGVCTAPATTFGVNVQQNINVVKVGVNFKFGG